MRGVKDAAVTTREGPRRQGRLVAYIVSEPTDAPGAHEIRAELRSRLPLYMVPADIVFLDELPLGPTGKVDRRALPYDSPLPAAAPAPATELERSIARIWEQVLETGGPIGPDDDFFMLGGDSLASAEIAACLEAETGVSLPVSLLAGAPTVRALAAELQRGRAVLGSSLVRLRSGGTEAPLVLLHGHVGHVLHYADLVRVAGANRPIWALEQLGSEASPIDDIASRQLETLLEANPPGPFLLAGFCYGAVVAQELACQLVTEGHDVALLALLAITPLEYPSIVSRGASEAWRRTHGPPSLMSKVRRHFKQARELPALERPRYVGRRIANLVAQTTDAPSESTRTARAFQRALARHEPRSFPGRALVVLHADDTADFTENPEREWAPLAREVEVVLLPGGGHAMLEEPGVRRLAELLRGRAAPSKSSLLSF